MHANAILKILGIAEGKDWEIAPWLIIEAPQIESFLSMTQSLQMSISRRMKEIIAAY